MVELRGACIRCKLITTREGGVCDCGAKLYGAVTKKAFRRSCEQMERRMLEPREIDDEQFDNYWRKDIRYP